VRGGVATITGAGSGMGLATARIFADEEMRLALFKIDQNSLASVLKDLERTEAGGALESDRKMFPLAE